MDGALRIFRGFTKIEANGGAARCLTLRVATASIDAGDVTLG